MINIINNHNSTSEDKYMPFSSKKTPSEFVHLKKGMISSEGFRLFFAET